MAGRDDVRDWYLRQHTNSSTAAAAAKPEGSKSGEKKAKEVSSDRNYLKLSPVVLNGPLSSNLQLRRDGPNVGVDTVVQELLASNVKTASNIAGSGLARGHTSRGGVEEHELCGNTGHHDPGN